MKPQSTTPQPEAPAPKKIDIICYPEGNIVKVTSDQLKELMEKGLVFYDDEWTEEKPNGQYGFNQENEDEIMKLTGSPAPISREVEGFTPGEWEFNQEENTVSKYRIYSTKDGRNVGWFDYDEETKESELANVTLIASAPTLYRENQQLKKDNENLEYKAQQDLREWNHIQDKLSLSIKQNQQQAKDIEELKNGLMIAQNYIENFIAKGGIGEAEKDLLLVTELINRLK